MNMKRNKKQLVLLLIKLFFFHSLCFSLDSDKGNAIHYKNPNLGEELSSYKKKVQQNLYKNSFVSVLKGIGFSELEAINAYISLASVYPLEILKDRGYLILPNNIDKKKIFAVNVNNNQSVILKKEKDKFVTYISSAELANELITSTNDLSISKKNIIKVDNNYEDYNKKIVIEESIFKQGENISQKLIDINVEKSKLQNVIKLIKEFIDPKKIKTGTIVKTFTDQGNLKAFYMPITKKKFLFIYNNKGFYNSKIVNFSGIKSNTSKILHENSNKITRINLFTNSNYQVFENFLNKGESIYELLQKYDIKNATINNIFNAVKPYYDLGQMRAGKKLEVILNYNQHLQGLSFKIDQVTKLQVILVDDIYKVYFYKEPYKIKKKLTEIIINSNFYNDSEIFNLPRSIFFELVKILSFSIDFQRDIKKGTTFLVLYEKFYDYEDNLIATGRILYSKVLLKSDLIEMYLFNKGGKEEYYDKDGKSIRKTLMKTPIDGARLSSGFGNRRHPVLGYNKMHKGIDFAAKKGTPIYAAGDGIIERANFYGGYGRYIRIRHNSQYKTVYAHLSKFAKKIKKNVKVKQGQVIGYVGTSGRSTGPHLHYEVLFNQTQINPNTLKMPEVEVLSKNELVEFNKKKTIISDILINIKN
ncbi:MAG: hypothetical protein CMJ06_05395 [Pelagibacterales bacterium]|nr:hypothetical protein [Pelagibacterales bacterium]OUU61593.1 MAG: hypothetical protein CBC22_07460 [Alphaproteobacteria bacterium TMED62]|tara:strand:- start:7191 stop:9122 length:1932 start_codon:yes stop_codon:yes gene_type:complete